MRHVEDQHIFFTRGRKMNPFQKKEYKVTLVGPSNSGKSTFLAEATGKTPSSGKTVGVAVVPFEVDPRHRIHVWDTAGSEDYQGLGQASYAAGSDLIVAFGGAKPEWVGGTPCLLVDPSESSRATLRRILSRLHVVTTSRL